MPRCPAFKNPRADALNPTAIVWHGNGIGWVYSRFPDRWDHSPGYRTEQAAIDMALSKKFSVVKNDAGRDVALSPAAKPRSKKTAYPRLTQELVDALDTVTVLARYKHEEGFDATGVAGKRLALIESLSGNWKIAHTLRRQP
jgi:hypothetical protein